jgi:TolC family type I secretion outer membrane protein
MCGDICAIPDKAEASENVVPSKKHKKVPGSPNLVSSKGKEVSTFEEAITAACENNKGWFASQTDKKIADESLGQSKMAFLPDVRGSLSLERDRMDRREKTGSIEKDNKSATKSTNTVMGLTITQNLFNGGATWNRMKGNESASAAAYHKLKFEEQRLIIRVLDAYTSTWMNGQKVIALKKKEENLKKTADSQQASLDAGAGTPTEVAQAIANCQRARYERISAETDLFAAKSEVERLTCRKASENIELPELKSGLPDDLDKLIALAMANNQSILSTHQDARAAISNLKATRGALAPSCDLSLQTRKSLNRNWSRPEDYLDLQQQGKNRSNNYNASLSITIPIFSNNPQSGNTYSAIAIASQQAQKAQFTAEDTRLEVKKECIVNWNKYVAATAMIKASKAAVESAEVASRGGSAENDMGVKSNTDILVQENQLLDARIGLAEAKRQRVLAAMQILMLSGVLDLQFVLRQSKV